MEDVLRGCRERKGGPFFSRVIPFLGHRPTPIWGYVSTADGYLIHGRAERAFAEAVFAAESEALRGGGEPADDAAVGGR